MLRAGVVEMMCTCSERYVLNIAWAYLQYILLCCKFFCLMIFFSFSDLLFFFYPDSPFLKVPSIQLFNCFLFIFSSTCFFVCACVNNECYRFPGEERKVVEEYRGGAGGGRSIACFRSVYLNSRTLLKNLDLVCTLSTWLSAISLGSRWQVFEVQVGH